MDYRTDVIRRTAYAHTKAVEDAKFTLKWTGSEYKVSKPNYLTGDGVVESMEEVVPLSVVRQILESMENL